MSERPLNARSLDERWLNERSEQADSQENSAHEIFSARYYYRIACLR